MTTYARHMQNVLENARQGHDPDAEDLVGLPEPMASALTAAAREVAALRSGGDRLAATRAAQSARQHLVETAAAAGFDPGAEMRNRPMESVPDVMEAMDAKSVEVADLIKNIP